MVNVVIYLENKYSPNDLVDSLLRERLIASASIDNNNVSYRLEDNKITDRIYNVITAQTKSLLFNEIVEWIESKFGKEIPILSIPIINSNHSFTERVKNNTKLI